ncbi:MULTISPECIES: Scr1 family TA system antitoxin-like transcriptional regulator [Streptomyces]|uniref:Scr1 family TA system antitoxin-like transcriptional regulator n=1 Tax=Streptomyces TaxID=1883 RepID=UPI001F0CBAD0|nr:MULTISPECIES: Scr1 family TA system antitoxin-like transcriptional regulator [Streptomyces]
MKNFSASETNSSPPSARSWTIRTRQRKIYPQAPAHSTIPSTVTTRTAPCHDRSATALPRLLDHLVPGLLQTEGSARAVLSTNARLLDLPDDAAARLERSKVPPRTGAPGSSCWSKRASSTTGWVTQGLVRHPGPPPARAPPRSPQASRTPTRYPSR